MEYQETISIVKGKSGHYDIKTANGVERKRMFVSDGENLCEFAKIGWQYELIVRDNQSQSLRFSTYSSRLSSSKTSGKPVFS